MDHLPGQPHRLHPRVTVRDRRRPGSSRPVLGLAIVAVLCVGLAVATPASAANGDRVNFTNPGDQDTHTCTDLPGGQVQDNDLEAGTVSRGTMTLVNGVYTVNLDGATVRSNDHVAVGYQAPPSSPIVWTTARDLGGGFNAGFHYRRDTHGSEARYTITITRTRSTRSETITYYASRMSAAQRERMLGFEAAVDGMRTAALTGGIGSAGALAASAFQHEYSNVASSVSVCGALVVGGVYLATRMVSWVSNRNSAINLFDRIRYNN